MMRLAMLSALTLQLLSLEAHAQTVTKDDLRKTVIHMRDLAKEQGALLEETKRQLATANVALDSARQQVAVARGEIIALNGQVESLRQWGLGEQARADAAEVLATKFLKDLTAEKAAHGKTLDRYLRLKVIAALVVAALAALAAMQLGPLLALAGPYGAIVPLAAGVGGFSLIWFLL